MYRPVHCSIIEWRYRINSVSRIVETSDQSKIPCGADISVNDSKKPLVGRPGEAAKNSERCGRPKLDRRRDGGG